MVGGLEYWLLTDRFVELLTSTLVPEPDPECGESRDSRANSAFVMTGFRGRVALA